MVSIRHIITIPLALWSFVLTFYTIGKLMLFLSTPLKIQLEHVWILNLLDNLSHFEITIYPITIDTILIILFILQHSLMKSRFIKSIWNLFGLKSGERCIYNLMTSFTLLTLIQNWKMAPSFTLWQINVENNKTIWWAFIVTHIIAWTVIYGGCIIMDLPEILGIKQAIKFAAMDQSKEDIFLMEILSESSNIMGFLDTIFSFLHRRTDFFYVCDSIHEFGFPPGANEEILLSVFRKFKNEPITIYINNDNDENNEPTTQQQHHHEKMINDFQIIEINDQEKEESASIYEIIDNDNVPNVEEEITIATDDVIAKQIEENDSIPIEVEAAVPIGIEKTIPVDEGKSISTDEIQSQSVKIEKAEPTAVFQSCDYYNGGLYENYCWCQTYSDIELRILIPEHIKSSKQLLVNIEKDSIIVKDKHSTQNTIFEGEFYHKCKSTNTIWSLTADKYLLVNFEKQKAMWWEKFIITEPKIDLRKIDCSRPMEELPEDEQNAINNLKWDHEQKLLGLPTSEEIKNYELLKRAWNVDGSPFKGMPFDPSLVTFQ